MIPPNKMILYLSTILIVLLVVVLIVQIGSSFTGTESNVYYNQLNNTVKCIGAMMYNEI